MSSGSRTSVTMDVSNTYCTVNIRLRRSIDIFRHMQNLNLEDEEEEERKDPFSLVAKLFSNVPQYEGTGNAVENPILLVATVPMDSLWSDIEGDLLLQVEEWMEAGGEGRLKLFTESDKFWSFGHKFISPVDSTLPPNIFILRSFRITGNCDVTLTLVENMKREEEE